MAINTVNKRRSVVGMAMVPDGTIASPDFQQIAGLYGGLTLTSGEVGLIGPFEGIFEDPDRGATLSDPQRRGIWEDPDRGATHKRDK